MLNRRTFLKSTAVTLPLANSLNALQAAVANTSKVPAHDNGSQPNLVPLPPRLAPENPGSIPWQRKIRRVGQSNMTEHDPAVMNIEEWANYWHTVNADIVFISVTGILAF